MYNKSEILYRLDGIVKAHWNLSSSIESGETIRIPDQDFQVLGSSSPTLPPQVVLDLTDGEVSFNR
jgi:hypothetical protein